MHDAHGALLISEQDAEINLNRCVGRIRIGGPLNVTHTAPCRVVPSVIRGRDKAFAHFVGDEYGYATWTAVLECGLHQGAQILLSCHVAHSVVNKDRVKNSTQAHGAYVAFEVFALGIEGSTHGEHLRRRVHKSHLEMSLQMRGVIASARSKFEQGSRRRIARPGKNAVKVRGFFTELFRSRKCRPPFRELVIEFHRHSHLCAGGAAQDIMLVLVMVVLAQGIEP